MDPGSTDKTRVSLAQNLKPPQSILPSNKMQGTATSIGALSWIKIAFITTFLSNVPWTIIFLVTQYFFGIRLYLIRKKEDCIRIQKNIGPCSHTIDGGKGYGYSLGLWYIASISVSTGDDHPEYSAWIITTPATYRRLTIEKEIEIFQVNNIYTMVPYIPPFKIMDRYGSNTNTYYRSRTLRLSIKPRPEQQSIIDSVKALLKKKRCAVILVHGPPGVGKTVLSLILANEIGGIYCNSFAPWEPGDGIAALYSDAEPSEASPLIIAFDEIDGPLQEIHRGLPSHKNLKTRVQNKQGWNQMFDEIQMGFYPNLVIVMTMNRSPDFINELDPSYIREHRVDVICSL